jgi:type 1 glutamine amidotransferase
MILRFLPVAFAVVASVAFAQEAPKTPSTQPLKVILLIGGEAHDYKHLEPIIAGAIRKYSGAEVTSRFGREALKDPHLADGYDAIVFDICYNGHDPTEYDNLVRIVTEGKPAVAIHATLHTFQVTDAWSEMLGMWSHVHDPYTAFTTIKLDETNPITKDWPANWHTAGDELYNTDNMRPEAHPLLKVKSPRDGREHIVAWTNEIGKGRVFGTTLGHDDKTATDADYQKLLGRGLLWVCGKL